MTSSLRRWLRLYLESYCARFVQILDLTRSSATGFYGIGGHAVDGDEPESERTAERIQQYGFRSRPRPSSRVVALAINGGAGNNVIVATDTPGTGPQSQADGDVELFSEHGQRLQMNSDKHLRIDAPAPSDVIVNGGTAKVSRVGDTSFSGELEAECQQDMSMPPILTVTIRYRSNDPASAYFLIPKKLLEFKVPGGTAVTPAAGGTESV